MNKLSLIFATNQPGGCNGVLEASCGPEIQETISVSYGTRIRGSAAQFDKVPQGSAASSAEEDSVNTQNACFRCISRTMESFRSP